MGADERDDFELLTQWRAGDRAAGEQLCTRHFAEIYRFFVHKIPSEADDLTQQTFLSCVKAVDQFRGISSFRTYLFAIARNVLYAYLRRVPKHEHVDLDVSSLADIVSSPSQQLGRQQELARLRAALHQLPVSQHVLLEFHFWHDLDMAALAVLFETTPGAIRVRLLRARRALRRQLEASGGGLPVGDRLSTSLVDPELDSDSDA